MKPLLLLEVVGTQETTFQKAYRRGRAIRIFARQHRASDGDTVGQVGAYLARGMTREHVAKDLHLHLRDMPVLEARASQRRLELEAQQRLRQAFAAE